MSEKSVFMAAQLYQESALADYPKRRADLARTALRRLMPNTHGRLHPGTRTKGGRALGVVSSVRSSRETARMESITCPRCGFVQDGGTECPRCGVIFARARQAGAAPERPHAPSPSASAPAPPAPTATLEELPARPGTLRRVYRIFRWVTLAALLTVVFLLLRKGRAPEFEADPQAASRAEAKLAEMDAAAARGIIQPAELDEGELNSWLARGLALAPPAGSAANSAEPTVEELRSNVRDVRVKLVEDRARVWFVFDFHGKDMTVTLEGRLHAEGGILRLDPTAMWVGSLPVPHVALRNAVNRIYSDPANLEKFRLSPDVADITVANGRLIVTPALNAQSPARFYVPSEPPATTPEATTEEPEQGPGQPDGGTAATTETQERTDSE
jgi:uncharacterized Zn finger protein (UPF0148 family)